jgi:CubicO group peptidase (beta-lactamase class C family)
MIKILQFASLLGFITINSVTWSNDLFDSMATKSLLFWTPEQQLLGYPHIPEIFNTRQIQHSSTILKLPKSKASLDDFSYIHKGKVKTLNDYFEQLNTTGLIVIKNGDVVFEQYALDHAPDKTWISFSVAKSVVSMLYGAAIKDGYIKSVDDKAVNYLPSLRGGAYANVTIKNLLQMSSGTDWNEDYEDPYSDVASSPINILKLIDYMGRLDKKERPGKRFNYNTGETNLAGAVLRAAIGNNLATYLHKKIWEPFGMESDAYWMLDEADGVEYGGCCINATLRDYGRLGLFALSNGTLSNGKQVLPDGWMNESTTPSLGARYYGYYWWLRQNNIYRATGVFGQFIWVNPKEQMVVAIHSAWDKAWRKDHDDQTAKLISSISNHLNKVRL